MDTRATEIPEEALAETPEDVAILYSWANLHGAKYRDFSASRREYRAQVRHRAAEELRTAELKARQQAETAAAEAERVAREAERAVKISDSSDNTRQRERALHEAEAASRRAAAERVEAARRAEAAASAEAVALREQREIADAHASAERQARSYSNSEIRRTPIGSGPGTPAAPVADPYEAPVHPGFDTDRSHPVQRIELDARSRLRDELPLRVPHERRGVRPSDSRQRPEGFRPDEASNVFPAFNDTSPSDKPRVALRTRATDSPADIRRTADAYAGGERPMPMQADAVSPPQLLRAAPPAAPHRPSPPELDSAPAWLYSSRIEETASRNIPDADTLQHSQERVASRWFALQGVFDPVREESWQSPAEASPARAKTPRPPALAVFSLAGGVGKTSLVATLGRALSSLGEKVLLADTTSHGLMPFYFGASELRPGIVRTFSPPAGSADAPIHLVSYEVERRGQGETRSQAVIDELRRSAGDTNRILLDLNAGSGWMTRRLADLPLTILVPLAPDMNSVISLHTVERCFDGLQNAEGKPVLPFYLLNGFDTSLPLHLDVREVLRGKLGERLLPFAVRRSPAVSEALAEGMTVLDYAPDTPIAEDYQRLAGWLRSLSTVAIQGRRNPRWSER